MVRFYQPEREDKYEVRFLIGGLDYRVRLAVIAACLVLGLMVQVLISVWVGWVLVLAGALLGTSRGIENKPRLRGKRRWEQVTLDEFQGVLDTAERSRRWARSIFNLASWPGLLSLLAAVYVVLLVAAWLGERGRFEPLGPLWVFADFAEGRANAAQKMWLLDAAALSVPIWLSGLRTTWKPEELVIKVKCLQEAEQCIRGLSPSGLTVIPQMEVSVTRRASSKKKRGLAKPEQDRQLPRDARLQVRFDEAPEEFLGLQIQLSINRVGRAYPYLYCVLLARQGFGLRQRLGSVSRVGEEMVEYSIEDDVEVVVYRQYTTRQKGYHTNYRARLRIVSGALKLTQQALAAPQPGVASGARVASVASASRSAGRPPRGRL